MAKPVHKATIAPRAFIHLESKFHKVHNVFYKFEYLSIFFIFIPHQPIRQLWQQHSSKAAKYSPEMPTKKLSSKLMVNRSRLLYQKIKQDLDLYIQNFN